MPELSHFRRKVRKCLGWLFEAPISSQKTTLFLVDLLYQFSFFTATRV
jgi:hypothetical protein